MGKLLHKGIDYTGVSPYEFVPVTEAEYNALTPAEQEDETKMYWLYDVDTVSADIDDEHTSAGTVWSSEKVSSEISDVQDQVDTNTDDISTLNSALADKADKSDTIERSFINNVTAYNVDITSYTATLYTIPRDGYVLCLPNSGACSVTLGASAWVAINANQSTGAQAIFVQKGQQVKVTVSGNALVIYRS